MTAPPPGIVFRLRAAGCVFAEDEARLLIESASTAPELAAMLERRVGGEPLEYILGWVDFCGLRIGVAPGVFVPRRRTEFLAGQVIEIIRGTLPRPPVTSDRPVVLDLCCGCGAVGAAVLAARPQIQLFAVDIDPAAVRCARYNLGAGAHVFAGDLYEPLPVDLRGRVDVLVANAPYVPTGRISLLPPEARLYEAPAALDGGRDGLDVVRRVIDAAPDWLAPGGSVLIETSTDQAAPVTTAMLRVGLNARVAGSDEPDATVVIGSGADSAGS